MSDVKTLGPSRIAVGPEFLGFLILHVTAVWRWTQPCAGGEFHAGKVLEGLAGADAGHHNPIACPPGSLLELSAVLQSWARLL